MEQVQAVAALGLSCILLVPAIFSKECRILCFRTLSHIPHGIGNIAAGFFEAIPIIGSLSVGIRFIKAHHKFPSTMITEHNAMRLEGFKFYPYASLNYPTAQSLDEEAYRDLYS